MKRKVENEKKKTTFDGKQNIKNGHDCEMLRFQPIPKYQC